MWNTWRRKQGLDKKDKKIWKKKRAIRQIESGAKSGKS